MTDHQAILLAPSMRQTRISWYAPQTMAQTEGTQTQAAPSSSRHSSPHANRGAKPSSQIR